MFTQKNNKIIAIIAEYNPFHNGHLYMINEIKKSNKDAEIIVIMSGDFVQRGEPSLFNKYERTKMALLNGIDLIIELPVLYALSSAEGFAYGAISIINSLGCVDEIYFGSECNDIDMLTNIAKLLLESNEEYDSTIKDLLKTGYNYPSARAKALAVNEDIESILNCPNNILGIEYIKALLKLNSNIIPRTILRADNGYNSSVINPEASINSASSIRASIKQNNANIVNSIPENCILYYSLYDNKDTINNRKKYSFINDYSDILYYKLLSDEIYGYSKYMDVSDDLSFRIKNNLDKFVNVSDFIEKIKTKNYTYSRISRSLFHILFDIKKEDAGLAPSYARILGFNRNSSVLRTIKLTTSIELITKPADFNSSDANSTRLWNLDIKASSIYGHIKGESINEYRQSPIIV